MASLLFKCDVCQVNTGSKANLESHLNVQKHWKKLNALGLKANSAQMQLLNKITDVKHTAVVQQGKNQKRTSITPENQAEKNKLTKNIDLDIPRIKEIVTSNKTFPQMMEDLMCELQFSINIMNDKYSQLCNDLQMVLSRRFRNCRVYPFGSTITGLGFKTSDLDCFVDVNRNSLPADLRNKDAAECTKVCRKILYQSHIFNKVIAIPNAKTPIVKCLHVPTGVNCDFNFKSMLGVCNSRLIKFFLSSNRNLLGAMIILKCWGKFHEISGTGKFTNYTLSMMFIFYLQIAYYLPSVFSLQLKKEHAFIQEGWNGGFCNDFNLLPKIDTPMEIMVPELLIGFFKYYSCFDYALNIVSPLVGKVIPKSCFNNTESLPPELVFYKQLVANLEDKVLKINSPICVQDPIVLNHNITGYIQQKMLQEFQNLCEGSWKTLESVKNDPCKTFYKILFTVQKPKVANFEMPNVEMCTFKIPYTTTALQIPTSSSYQDLGKQWFDKLNNFLMLMLTKVYQFDITAKKESAPKKFIKMEGRTDVHDTDVCDTTTFHCIGHINTWDGRKNMSKGYDATNDKKIKYPTTLDREIAVSDYLSKLVHKNTKKSPALLVDFDFTITTKINPIEAKFTLRNNLKSIKNHFRPLANNFGILVPLLFEKYLKENTESGSSGTKNKELIVISDDDGEKLLDTNSKADLETLKLFKEIDCVVNDDLNRKNNGLPALVNNSVENSVDDSNLEIKIIEKIDSLLSTNENLETESTSNINENIDNLKSGSNCVNKFLESIENIAK